MILGQWFCRKDEGYLARFGYCGCEFVGFSYGSKVVAAEGDRIDRKEKKVTRVSERSMVLCATEPFQYVQKVDELSQPFDLEFAQLRPYVSCRSCLDRIYLCSGLHLVWR